MLPVKAGLTWTGQHLRRLSFDHPGLSPGRLALLLGLLGLVVSMIGVNL
jgi:hypothetical protein